MTGRHLRTRSIALSATFATLVAGAATACSTSEDEAGTSENYTFYCVDEDSTVVDESNCDDDRDNRHWIAYGAFPVGLLIGHRLASASRFRASDAAARQRWGLPPTGRISNGTVKTGVIGTTGKSDESSGS